MASAKRPHSECSPAIAAVETETKRVRLQADEQEQITMDNNPTRTLHPRDLLRRLADSMNGQHDELSVTIPAYTTWRSALQAVASALNGVDEPLIVLPPHNPNRRIMREWGLQAASESRTENLPALPIRTNVDLDVLPPRPSLSEERRERLRQMAKEAANTEFRDPYASLRSTLEDSCLPMIRADLVVRGMDGRETDPVCDLKGMNMIFDTGAHSTVISEELLSPSFREYLGDPVHDPYRRSDSLSVQVHVSIALSNCPVSIDIVAVVVPKSKLPNQLVGILFGQAGGIDRLNFRATPRHVLRVNGEEIPGRFWGDILADQYVNLDGEIVSI
ncbi:unnamed protein product [Penicillium viridicatum]